MLGSEYCLARAERLRMLMLTAPDQPLSFGSGASYKNIET